MVQNIRFRQNIRPFERSDSENLGFGRPLYFQESRTSRRHFLLLRISFPGKPIFMQFVPASSRSATSSRWADSAWQTCWAPTGPAPPATQ